MRKAKLITLNIKLPDHFLDEEVQDGFLVPKRKEVWAVELDLILNLIEYAEI